MLNVSKMVLTRHVSCLCGLWSPSQSVAWLHHSVRSLSFVTLISAGVSTLARDAAAADIIPYSDPVMDCGILVSGPIVEGDTDKLAGQIRAEILRTYSTSSEINDDTGKPFIVTGTNIETGSPTVTRNYIGGTSRITQVDQISGNYIHTGISENGVAENSTFGVDTIDSSIDSYTRKVCFNSRGGSFPEGLKIAQILGENAIGTAIAAEHSCESACAIAFMGGSWSRHFDGWERFEDVPKGDRSRTLHPRGRLGFHATALALRQEQYTAIDIDKAYALALDTVNLILRLRANKGYNFPDYVLSKMLETPPSEMYYIDTVEAAIRAGVDVAPAALNTGGPEVIIPHLCDAASVRDFESDSIIRNNRLETIDGLMGDFGSSWIFEYHLNNTGDLVQYCEVKLLIGTESSQNDLSGTEPIARINAGGYFFNFQTYPLPTKIADISVDASRSVQEFRISAEKQAFAASQPTSCWLTSLITKIVNVDEFVNLRSEPGLNSRIISQVSRSDHIRVMDYMPTKIIGEVWVYGSLKSIGDQTRRDECARACSTYVKSSSDADVKAIALQCIDENIIWAEIKDKNGNTGWVSRKFLHEFYNFQR